MAIRPSQPEIITVNSETLQSQIRDLLPSQNGFGSELQASNVITPVIDLTSAAEGSGLPTYLQTALAFGSQTAFDVGNTTTNIATSPGFYRVTGVASCISSSSQTNEVRITMTDGVSTKVVWQLEVPTNSSTTVNPSESVDLTFFLAAGETLSITTNSTKAKLVGSIRQVATGDGTLVQPNGYPL